LNARGSIIVAALLAIATPASADCTKDTDCKGDRVCDAGVCRAPAVVASCRNDKDCAGALVCEQHVCVAVSTPAMPPPATTSSAATPGPTASLGLAATSAPAASISATAAAPPPRDARSWLVDMNMYLVLYPYVSGGDGLLINLPVHIEHPLKDQLTFYVTPDWAFTSYSGMSLMTIGVNGGVRYYADKERLFHGWWVGGNVGFATQIIGEGSFGMNVLGEAGYTLASDGAWTLALGVTGGFNIPLYIANADSSGPSGLSPVSTSFVYGWIVSPGIRF